VCAHINVRCGELSAGLHITRNSETLIVHQSMVAHRKL